MPSYIFGAHQISWEKIINVKNDKNDFKVFHRYIQK